MAEPVIPVHRITADDGTHFDLADLMSDEMAQIKSWTGCKNRAEFYDALRQEDPDAITAAFTLVKRRNGEPDAAFRGTRVNLDRLVWTRVVDDRPVDLIVEERDGEPLIVQLDKKGDPLTDDQGAYLDPTYADDEIRGFVLLKTPEGHLRWRYVDTGEEVRPTEEPPASGSSGSPSTEKTRRGSDSTSGTQSTNAA